MALKTAQTKIAEKPETLAVSGDTAEDFTLIEQETAARGQECGEVLRKYMEQLSMAVPLEASEEQRLWQKLSDIYRELRIDLGFCGFSYSFAVRMLEKLDTPESLDDFFPQSLLVKLGKRKILEKSRFLLQRYSEIHNRLKIAFESGDAEELKKERAAGSELLAEYPFQNELILEMAEEINSHRLVMDSGNESARKLLLENMLFCTPEEFSVWFRKLEDRLNELSENRNKLVFSYLRMVFSIAKKFQGHGVPLADLIQEGNIGLMKAINKFDSGLGHRFSTYATWWIKQCVCHAVGRQSRVIRLPSHMLAVLSKINKAEQQFLLENGREALPEEIAEKLEMTREKVSSLKRMAMQTISLQAPVYSGRSGRDILLEDTVENIHDEDDPMRNLAKKILAEKLSTILSSLPPRTRQILTYRYGLNGVEQMSLNAMSEHFRISRERIRQIELNALTRIRNPEIISQLEDYFS